MTGEDEKRPACRWQRPDGASRRAALTIAAGAVAILLLQPVWLRLAPWLGRCQFRAVTGIPCPTCGMTRTAVALLEGRPLDALAINPLAAVAALALLAFGLLGPLWVLAGGPIPELPAVALRRAVILGLLLALANWAYLISHA